MEVAAAARPAGLDARLTGDGHAASPAYAATFSPLPTVARPMSVTGTMPVGVVLLVPFYHPLLLAEQLASTVIRSKRMMLTSCGPPRILT